MKEIILVVDDNRQISDFLVSKLLPSMGFEALAAYDGKTALKIIHERSPSLLLLDLQLPDTTGLDLLRELSRNGRQVPAILFTAHGSEQVAVDAFRLGVHDYLTKPVEVDSLNQAITRAMAVTRLNRENAALMAQLKGQVEWLTTLARVGKSMTSTLELDEVLRRIVEAGVHLTKAEEGFLALLDEKNGQLYLRAAKNIDEKTIKTMRLLVNDTLLGAVINSGKPYRSTQLNDDPQLLVSTGFLVHSIVHVPIISKGKPLGVFSVDNRTDRRLFTELDEAQLVSLADYAAAALENAGLYQRAQQEIFERRKVEKALRQSEERYELAVRGANDGIWDWDLVTNQVYYSPRWESMLGYRDDEVGNSPVEWFNRIHPDDVERTKLDISNHIKGMTTHFENEHRMRHKDGSYLWMLSRGIAVRDADHLVIRMAGSLSDISARKEAEAKLLHDAFYDPLTNLPNRALFLDRLNIAVERAKRREDYLFAVLFLDLDRFKDVNDSMGHMVGDDLLVAIAQKLRKGRRSTDTVSRLGGDEFVILLEDIPDPSAAHHVADLIQKDLSEPIMLGDQKVFITTSIGIVLGNQAYNLAEDVLRDADIAMYSAKANGRARFEVFHPSMREGIMRRLTLETELRHALENQELRVYYQPIVSLESGRLVGFEALVRWQHPALGLLPPKEFIPLAEETGMVLLIDRWVMRQACRQMREWQDEIVLEPPLSISVNLSGRHLAQEGLLEEVKSALEETGLSPTSLKLEITESAIVNNMESTSGILSQIQDLGVQVQIDDFGVGYSSLNYLSNFPVNALKIDQFFVGSMDDNNNNLKIVQAIVSLTQRLGVGVIAEGVETEKQLAQLQDLGCEFGQGFLVSIPLDKDAARTLLKELLFREQSLLPDTKVSNSTPEKGTA